MNNIIKFFSKTIQKINTDNIKADVYIYEISKEDMEMIAFSMPEQYEVRRLFLCGEDEKHIEMIVDNIETGRVLQGGLVDNKYILTYYIVETGLDKLLTALSTPIS